MAKPDKYQPLKGNAMAITEKAADPVAATDTTTVVENPTEQPVVTPTPTEAPVSTPTPTPAPTVTAPAIKVGTIVKSNEQTLAKPAPVEVVKAIVKQSTVNPVSTLSDFNQYIAKLNQTGTTRQKYVISHLDEYVKKTGPGSNLSDEEATRQEEVLWRVMKNVVETEDGFKDCFKLLIRYFGEYKTGVFHEAYMFRNFRNMNISSDDGNAYLNLANLIKAAAGVNNKQDLLRIVNFNSAITSVFSEEARGRILGYFNT